MSNINSILEKKDKEVVLKYLIDEDKFNHSELGIIDLSIYKNSFEVRNGFSLENILKNFKDRKIEEVNEADVDKVYSIMKISKSVDLSPATEGIAKALEITLNRLYSSSRYKMETFTSEFDNADLVRCINLFMFYIKLIQDDLSFMTFLNGEIASVSITQAISKCYDDYYDNYYSNNVSSWDIEQVNNIEFNLNTSILLLDSLIKIFPDNPDFTFFKTILETGLGTMKDFQLNFKDMVILANSQNIINVENTPFIAKDPPVIFYNQIAKNKTQIKKNLYDVKIVKSNQGLVTGIVLEPEEVDLQGQIVSKEEIYKSMKNFMLEYNQFDLMHDEKILKSDKGEGRQIALIQNFIAPQDLKYGEKIVKEGTWIQETIILDQEILKGLGTKYTGYSIMGTADVIPN